MDWLSVVMIVQDEAHRLGALLSHISNYCKEIVIIDGGSKDGTQELVKTFPKVKLFEIPFTQDFGAQKNRAIEKATGEWILLLDADEMPDPDLMDNLANLTRLGYQAYAFPRKTRIDGRLYNLIDHDYQIRFWINGKGIKYTGKIHESPTGFSSMGKVNMWLNHNKSTDEQQKDNEIYWDMGQTPPQGWFKEEGKWTKKE